MLHGSFGQEHLAVIEGILFTLFRFNGCLLLHCDRRFLLWWSFHDFSSLGFCGRWCILFLLFSPEDGDISCHNLLEHILIDFDFLLCHSYFKLSFTISSSANSANPLPLSAFAGGGIRVHLKKFFVNSDSSLS